MRKVWMVPSSAVMVHWTVPIPAVERLPAIPLTGMMDVSRSLVKFESTGDIQVEAWVSMPTGV